MNRCHQFDNDLDTPPPPPWWHGLLITILFIAVLIALIAFCTGCACSCQPDPAAAAQILSDLTNP